MTVTNADGYSRWFNPVEFTAPGLLGYLHGDFATSGYSPVSTLNPYKYYANSLNAEDDLWAFLSLTTDNGRFEAGTSCTRRFDIHFPIPTPGVKYGYAVLANWEWVDVHPANMIEAAACRPTVTPDVYYVDPGNNGGNLILDIDLVEWNGMQPSTIYIETTVASAVASFDAATAWTGTMDNYSTYHVELAADAVTSTLGNEFWVIPEYSGYDYTSEWTPDLPDVAPDAPLAAFFRYDLFVAAEPYNLPPDITEIYDDLSGGPGMGVQAIVDSSTTAVYGMVVTDPDMGPTDPPIETWYVAPTGVTMDPGTHQVADSTIDWYGDHGHGIWDLYARADDGMAYDEEMVTITANDDPYFNPDAITGNAVVPFTADDEDYSVTAVDDDAGDVLTFDWTITESDHTTVVDQWTGVGDTINVDWAGYGVSTG
jgi:hypothetical protein